MLVYGQLDIYDYAAGVARWADFQLMQPLFWFSTRFYGYTLPITQQRLRRRRRTIYSH